MGEEPENYIVRPSNPTLLGGDGADSVGYLMIGVEHLIGGIDHAFRSRFGAFHPLTLDAKNHNRFTIAHSITLALSVMNIVSGSGPGRGSDRPIHCLFSQRTGSTRGAPVRLTRTSPWLMAFVFGLLHGLGFAGALSEIGLPEDALFQFTIIQSGYELGQILVVLLLVLVLWLWRKATQALSLRPDLVHQLAAYVMGSRNVLDHRSNADFALAGLSPSGTWGGLCKNRHADHVRTGVRVRGANAF